VVMSTQARQSVCDAFGQITDGQRADLMNEDPATGTSTALIAFLQELFTQRDGVWVGKLVCTAVRSDHPTYDGPDGHSGGNAIDYGQINDDADEHLIEDTQDCPGALGVGLGGPYQAYADACGGYNAQSKLFEDNSTDHIHVQVCGY
jgi:hypothetical protein